MVTIGSSLHVADTKAAMPGAAAVVQHSRSDHTSMELFPQEHIAQPGAYDHADG
jgi:hypothetical protein